jgi:hypothetical protein
MTWSGWIFLILSWGLIIGLTIFCVHRMFKEPYKDL